MSGLAAYSRKTQTEVDRLDDEALLDHIVAAREAGDAEGAKQAAGVLAFRHEQVIRCRVAARVPAQDVDDVAMSVLESVVSSAFQGKVLGEFHSFLRVIGKRRIADFHERRKRTLDADPLPDESGEDEGSWGQTPSVEDRTGEHAIMDAVERVLARRNQTHRLVIRLYGPAEMNGSDLSAAGVGERVAEELEGTHVSEDNVAQIWRRFKTELRAELDVSVEGGSGG